MENSVLPRILVTIQEKVPLNNQTDAYLRMLDVDPKMFEDFLYYDQGSYWYRKVKVTWLEKKKEENKGEINYINEGKIDLGQGFNAIPSKNQNKQPKKTNGANTQIKKEFAPSFLNDK